MRLSHGDDDMDAVLSILRSSAIEAPILGPAHSHHPGSGTRLMLVSGLDRCVRVCPAGLAKGGAAEWPRSTSLWCWYCCHPFDTPPLPMPVCHDARRDLFRVMGTFCSWSCMKAHNMHSTSYFNSVNANIITLFHRRCTGRLGGIKAAPPRIALKVFGGHMTIDEFRAASAGQAVHAVLPPRMIVHEHAIQESRSTTARQDVTKRARLATDLKAVVDFKDVVTKNETLRLKRPKPLQSNKNLLERTIGLSMAQTPASS
jgi:hypothetical protein